MINQVANMTKKNTKEAFIWIVEILRKHKVSFKVTSGFAAKIYGSKRPLADIDIDISEKKFRNIITDIKKYIIFGPKRYKDKNWDLNVITLKYKGQEIDLCGIENMKIFNCKTKKWQKHPAAFSKPKKIKIYGKIVPVIKKEDLINYKKILGRRVDRQDIRI